MLTVCFCEEKRINLSTRGWNMPSLINSANVWIDHTLLTIIEFAASIRNIPIKLRGVPIITPSCPYFDGCKIRQRPRKICTRCLPIPWFQVNNFSKWSTISRSKILSFHLSLVNSSHKGTAKRTFDVFCGQFEATAEQTPGRPLIRDAMAVVWRRCNVEQKHFVKHRCKIISWTKVCLSVSIASFVCPFWTFSVGSCRHHPQAI